MAPPMLVWGARNNPGRTFVARPCSDDAEKTNNWGSPKKMGKGKIFIIIISLPWNEGPLMGIGYICISHLQTGHCWSGDSVTVAWDLIPQVDDLTLFKD